MSQELDIQFPRHKLDSGQTAFLVVLADQRVHPKVLKTLRTTSVYLLTYALSRRQN